MPMCSNQVGFRVISVTFKAKRVLHVHPSSFYRDIPVDVSSVRLRKKVKVKHFTEDGLLKGQRLRK